MGRVGTIVAIALTVCAVARAEEVDEFTKSQQEAAKAFEAGDFAAAIDALKRANGLYPHPDLQYNIALAYDQWGDHCADSLTYLRQYFESCSTVECEGIEESRKQLERVEAKCQATLQVRAVPRGAQISLDGRVVGTSTASVKVDPGPHRVEATLAGYIMQSQRLEAAPKAVMMVNLALASEAQPAPAPIVIAAEPTPPEASSLPVIGWTAIGVGAAALVAGGVFVGLEQKAKSDAEDIEVSGTGSIADLNAKLATAHDFGVARTVSFVAGGVAAGAGIVMLVLAPADESDVAVRAVFGVNGVAIAGIF